MGHCSTVTFWRPSDSTRFVLVGLVILGVLGALWTVEAAGGPARLPRPLADRLRRVRARHSG